MRAFEAALSNIHDAVASESSIDAETLSPLNPSPRRRVGEFLEQGLDKVCAEGPELRANIFEHCDVVVTIVCERPKALH